MMTKLHLRQNLWYTLMAGLWALRSNKTSKRKAFRHTAGGLTTWS